MNRSPQTSGVICSIFLKSFTFFFEKLCPPADYSMVWLLFARINVCVHVKPGASHKYFFRLTSELSSVRGSEHSFRVCFITFFFLTWTFLWGQFSPYAPVVFLILFHRGSFKHIFGAFFYSSLSFANHGDHTGEVYSKIGHTKLVYKVRTFFWVKPEKHLLITSHELCNCRGS